jgi:hypothetical protein
MTYVVTAVFVVILLFFGWRLGALGGATRERRRAELVAERLGLDAVTPGFVRRVVRRQRWVPAGVTAGFLATPLVDDWMSAGRFGPMYVGLALGAVADALTRPGPPPGTPRVAHAASTRLRDHVPAWLLAVAVLMAAAAPALAVLWAVAPRDGRGLGTLIVTGGAVTRIAGYALAGLAVSLLLARVVVGRPQPAGSTEDLAVDDALRAQAVRDVLHLTGAVSFVMIWSLSLALTGQDVTGPARRIGGAAPLALLIGLVLVGLAHELAGGPKHWRSRLVAV